MAQNVCDRFVHSLDLTIRLLLIVATEGKYIIKNPIDRSLRTDACVTRLNEATSLISAHETRTKNEKDNETTKNYEVNAQDTMGGRCFTISMIYRLDQKES